MRRSGAGNDEHSEHLWLPLQQNYANQISTGEKTIEGRVDRGTAGTVVVGQLLQLGSVIVRVLAVGRFPDFRSMLDCYGYQRATPRARDLEHALQIYHRFRGYAEAAAVHGVIAYEIRLEQQRQPPGGDDDDADDDAVDGRHSVKRLFMARALGPLLGAVNQFEVLQYVYDSKFVDCAML